MTIKSVLALTAACAFIVGSAVSAFSAPLDIGATLPTIQQPPASQDLSPDRDGRPMLQVEDPAEVQMAVQRLEEQALRIQGDLQLIDREIAQLESMAALRQLSRELNQESGLFEEHVGGIPGPSSMDGRGSARPTGANDGSAPYCPVDGYTRRPPSLFPEEWFDRDSLEINRTAIAQGAWIGFDDNTSGGPVPEGDEPNTDAGGAYQGGSDRGDEHAEVILPDATSREGDFQPSGDGIDPSEANADGDPVVDGAMEVVSPEVIATSAAELAGEVGVPGSAGELSRSNRIREANAGPLDLQARIRRLREQRRAAQADLESVDGQRQELVDRLGQPQEF